MYTNAHTFTIQIVLINLFYTHYYIKYTGQFFQLVVLQMTTLLLNVAGVAHVVDAALAYYTKSVLSLTVRLLTL